MSLERTLSRELIIHLMRRKYRPSQKTYSKRRAKKPKLKKKQD
jgi:hypothetical protein